jgi:hypothetical protein
MAPFVVGLKRNPLFHFPENKRKFANFSRNFAKFRFAKNICSQDGFREIFRANFRNFSQDLLAKSEKIFAKTRKRKFSFQP